MRICSVKKFSYDFQNEDEAHAKYFEDAEPFAFMKKTDEPLFLWSDRYG
jgi:hypothetical protein